MYLFKQIELTPEEIKFLETTDFDISDIGDEHIVDASLFIQAMGLEGYEMGNLKVSEDGSGFVPIDPYKKITDQDIAMMASYIKQQVRDTYGVQLMLEEVI